VNRGREAVRDRIDQTQTPAKAPHEPYRGRATPVVSVIMPTYNQSAYLREAVDSLLAQTLRDWELLVVDDGSTDDTPAVLRAFADETRIRAFRQANSGQAVARNLALRHARGRYVAFLDSDNRWLPDKLRCQVDYLEAHPEVDVLYGGIRLIDDAGAVLGVQERYRPTGTIWRDLLVDNYVTFNTTILSRRLLQEYGGQDPDVRYGPDFDLWLRMSPRCRFEYLPQVMCEYRVEGRRISDNVLARMQANRGAIRRFLTQNRGLLGWRGRRAVWGAFYGKFARALSANRQPLRAVSLGAAAVLHQPVSTTAWRSLLGAMWRGLKRV
jgi:glycosyltransferase involved in cell wall biosynthesis